MLNVASVSNAFPILSKKVYDSGFNLSEPLSNKILVVLKPPFKIIERISSPSSVILMFAMAAIWFI